MIKVKFKLSFYQIKTLIFLFAICQTLLSSCQTADVPEPEVAKKSFVLPNNPNFIYHGRVDFTNSSEPRFFWAGSGFSVWFEGTSAEVILDDFDGTNYYNAIIDNNDSERVIIDCMKGETSYLIAKGLESGVHKLQLLRRTDSTTPHTKFKGIEIDGDKQIVAPLKLQPSLKIEFYGNSITSGHGILDETRQNNDDRSTWDNYHTYAAKTARSINADYRCISMSGIGIMVSWYPLIMPELYDRIDPNNKSKKWDFSQWQADIVVVNLFQNDSWLINNMPQIPNTEERINSYRDFIQTIRQKYPCAMIVCTLGNMDACKDGSPWTEYISSAVEKFKTEANDSNIFYVPMKYKNTDGHPTVSEHQQMADVLIPFIKNKLENR